MFCPNCGLEDPNQTLFCRSCGTSLNVVRNALEHPDAVTTSAITAREGIGRAIAAKIAEFRDAEELRQAVHEILPAIERFLESPEEKRLQQREQRLNRLREGAMTSIVGLAIILCFLLISWVTNEEKILIVSALGLLVLMIGLGIIMTALWFTDSAKASPTSSRRPPPSLKASGEQQGLLPLERSTSPSGFDSVTEGTTRQL